MSNIEDLDESQEDETETDTGYQDPTREYDDGGWLIASPHEIAQGEIAAAFQGLGTIDKAQFLATHEPRADGVGYVPKPGGKLVITETLMRSILGDVGADIYVPEVPETPEENAARVASGHFDKSAGIFRVEERRRSFTPIPYSQLRQLWKDWAAKDPAALRAVGRHGLTLAQFQELNDKAQQTYADTLARKQAERPFRAQTVEEIEAEDDGADPYLVPGAVPSRTITILYGKQESTKSIWSHMLGICIANGLPFFGCPMTRGRVLYYSCDPNARKKEVQRRLIQIRSHLELPTIGANFRLADPKYRALDLTDPASVIAFLAENPGDFDLVVIDSLAWAVNNQELTQMGVITAALEGAQRICDTANATVIIVQHPNRSDQSHPYGSAYQEPGCAAMLHFAINKRDDVTAEVVRMKNDGTALGTKYNYHFPRADGPWLESLDDKPRIGAPAIVAVKRPDILALMPAVWTSIREARKEIEHLLQGSPAAREKEWARLRTGWEATKLVEQRDGTIRRRVV